MLQGMIRPPASDQTRPHDLISRGEKAFYYFQLDSGGCKSENCGQLFAFKMGQDGRANHLKSQRDKGGGKALLTAPKGQEWATGAK